MTKANKKVQFFLKKGLLATHTTVAAACSAFIVKQQIRLFFIFTIHRSQNNEIIQQSATAKGFFFDAFFAIVKKFTLPTNISRKFIAPI